MSRTIDTEITSELTADVVRPFFLCDLTFETISLNLWSGYGDLDAPYGSSLITNPDFVGSLTGWTEVELGTGTVTHIADGNAEFVANGFANRSILNQSFTTVAGQKYIVRIKHTGVDMRIRLRDTVNNSNIYFEFHSAGTYSIAFTATSTTTQLQLRNEKVGTANVSTADAFNATTYTGAGELLAVSGFAETADLSAQGITLTLSGMNTAVVQEARDEDYQGKAVKLRMGAFDSYGTIVDLPFDVFNGFMDVITIDDEGESSIISLTAENKLIRLQRSNERRYTSQDQKIKHPTDQGFEFVTKLQDSKVSWGKETTNFGRNEYKVRDGRETEH